MKRVRYSEDYVCPVWAEIVGCSIALISIVAIPLGAVPPIYEVDDNTLIQVNMQEDNKSYL